MWPVNSKVTYPHFIKMSNNTLRILLPILIALLAMIICLSSAQDESQSTSSYNINQNSHETSNPSIKEKQLREFRASEVLESIREWSSRFGREVFFGTQEATCLRGIKDQFDPAKSDPPRRGQYKASVVSIDWTILHSEIVKSISNTMSWHKSAVESIARAAESLAGNHTLDQNLRVEYVDVHRLQNILDDEIALPPEVYSSNDSSVLSSNTSQLNPEENPDLDFNQADLAVVQTGEPNKLDTQQYEPLPSPASFQVESTETSGEWETPIKYLKLTKHPNFDVLINTEESAVHIPVHIYPGDPQIMNGIAWSDELTKVFRDNFVRNPKLTNQYFASQLGFMRLYPAQKWQIPRNDPDLYDARMRPWYVAGASSRKDVIILVDSSGSMTGSRRDIAKGVVFEILDTLTDNDHFMILKFSDKVQQIGIPDCPKMRFERKESSIPPKNTLYQPESLIGNNENETDVDSLYLLPATGRNIRHIKTNFTIPTSGIANFSNALVAAFEVLRKYKDSEQYGSQCNQAIMLITDGSPSDFEYIFNRYNYPNAPVRMFTYLIGREANDGSHTKMMACHNRGYYTHVINLAEVRETVQQYIPVMARPLVLNGTHPITWTPAYGELTYQILTDWIWESKRRERAKSLLSSSNNNGQTTVNGFIPEIKVTSDDSSNGPQSIGSELLSEDENYEQALDEELESIDLFGYSGNTNCFWQTKSNDLLTTVVQPIYDKRNESLVTEKFLVKNVWTSKSTMMRTAQILGVAAADMKINDIIALAPSHKLGANGYAVMLTNNGFIMHHPDLRSILEPFSLDASEKNMRILKPFFSSLDFTEVEHILNSNSDDGNFLELRKDAVSGLTGWRELLTKRTYDCQQRVQTRKQSFYYKPIRNFPFSFMISIPQPYGSHRIEAQVEIKNSNLPERLTTYFTTSDYDLWTVHPDYQYCEGPSNNTISTLLDMFQRIESKRADDIQWTAAESTKPPLFLPGKIVCDKDLVQSLVYDAVATFGFSDTCTPPSPDAETNLLGMFGFRFSFVATRSGLTRVRYFDANDISIKKEALAFAKKHSRAIDETFYARTVDYNMLVNNSATLIQVPFITYLKIRDRFNRYEMNQAMSYDESSLGAQGNQDSNTNTGNEFKMNIKDMSLMERLELILANSSLHVIASQSIIVNEGAQRAVAGVTGVFYDYASFVIRFFNSTSARLQDGRPVSKAATCYTDSPPSDASCDSSKMLKCGHLNDTIDCILIDNNGFIVVSEDLEFIGRHLKYYEPAILNRLVNAAVFHEINITDYQSVCLKQEEKQQSSGSLSLFKPYLGFTSLIRNFISAIFYTWTLLDAHLFKSTVAIQSRQQFNSGFQLNLALLPNKTYLRPCEKTRTRYETRLGTFNSDTPEYYKTRCNCDAWFIYEQVPHTNLIMLVVDSSNDCRQNCDQISIQQQTDSMDELNQFDLEETSKEGEICSMLGREHQLYRKKLDSCFYHHPDEEQIKLCGGSTGLLPNSFIIFIVTSLISVTLFCFVSTSKSMYQVQE